MPARAAHASIRCCHSARRFNAEKTIFTRHPFVVAPGTHTLTNVAARGSKSDKPPPDAVDPKSFVPGTPNWE
jgi:hypothetical protein